jgi:hypothetical protein
MAPPLEKPQKGEAYLADKAVLLVLERAWLNAWRARAVRCVKFNVRAVSVSHDLQ